MLTLPHAVLSCSATPDPQIRVIVNDGVVPLTSLRGCAPHPDGLCSVDAFVGAMREMIQTTDWSWGCHGDWTVPPGDDWHTTVGYPPERE